MEQLFTEKYPNVPLEAIVHLFHMSNLNKDCIVDEFEFVQFYKGIRAGVHIADAVRRFEEEKQMKNPEFVFEMADEDQDGSLTREDLDFAMSEILPSVPEHLVDQMFHSADYTHDGQI